jgi:hypothetical protein
VYSHLLEKPVRNGGLAAMFAAIDLIVQSILAVAGGQGVPPISSLAYSEICPDTIARAIGASGLGVARRVEVARERILTQVSNSTTKRILVAVVNPGLAVGIAAGHGAGD